MNNRKQFRKLSGVLLATVSFFRDYVSINFQFNIPARNLDLINVSIVHDTAEPQVNRVLTTKRHSASNEKVQLKHVFHL